MSHSYTPLPTLQYELLFGPILLKDGRTASIRPMLPSDRQALEDFVGRISPDALFYRFFGHVSPQEAVDFLLRTFEEDKLSLVVLSGEPQQIIATGEYIQEMQGGDSAEVAFLVDDAHQGKGIGSLLLERLALAGVHRGMRTFSAFVLASNRQMLDVFRATGYEIHSETESGEIEVKFNIEPNPQMVAKFEQRERLSTVASLVPLFNPRHIAVVGASRQAGSVGRTVFKNLIAGGYAGQLYAVNPQAAAAGQSIKVAHVVYPFTTLERIAEPLDFAIIATSKDFVLEAAMACGKNKTRVIMVLTTDLDEDTIEALHQLCLREGMRLLGPGSLGFISSRGKVMITPINQPPQSGRMAMSAHSGALGMSALEYAHDSNIGLSSFVSLGAKIDITSNDLIQYWEDDPNINIILLHLEQFANPRRFSRLARRVGQKKPLVVVNPSRTPLADGLFKQSGVIRARGLEQMLDIAALLAHQPLPLGPNIAIVTNTMGAANLAAEILEAEGLNPSVFDLRSTAKAQDYKNTCATLIEHNAFHGALAIFVPLGHSTLEEVHQALSEMMDMMLAANIEAPVAICMMSGTNQLRMSKRKVPIYRFPEPAASAFAAAYNYKQWRDKPKGVIPDFEINEQARELSDNMEGILNPTQCLTLLQCFGMVSKTPRKTSNNPLVVSVQTDRLFGPVLSLRLEQLPTGPMVLGSRITPIDETDAKALISSLQRPQAPDKLKDILMRVSRMVEEISRIQAIELTLHPNDKGYDITHPHIELEPHHD